MRPVNILIFDLSVTDGFRARRKNKVCVFVHVREIFALDATWVMNYWNADVVEVTLFEYFAKHNAKMIEDSVQASDVDKSW